MKLFKIISVLTITIIGFHLSQAQIDPEITFSEDPKTHNMSICSDGEFYYTVNGGNAVTGQIGKFNMNGNLIGHYPIELDMRSIMYNKKDKCFYVNNYDEKLYKIEDITTGNFEVVLEDVRFYDQSSLALHPNGKKLYEFKNGLLKVYNFKNGKITDTFYDLKHGDDLKDGSTAVAVSKKRIYTWDGYTQTIFVYNKKGEYVKTLNISKGTYGFSLSWTNGLLFVSEDGNYSTGHWFGYDL